MRIGHVDLDRSTLEARARAAAEHHMEEIWVNGRPVIVARCRMLAGPWIYVDPRDAEIAPHLLRDGYWESWLTVAMLRALQPDAYCVDLGANVGYYALLMASVVGPGGRVLAVEPHPDLAVLVAHSAEVNRYGHLDVRQVAVGADAGAARLVVPHTPDGRRLMGSALLAGTSMLPADVYPVRVEPLDALVADWPRVDVVKVDLEGAEVDAWRGMQRTIARCPQITVMMEIAEGRGYDVVAFCRDVEAQFPLRVVDTTGHLRPARPQDVLRWGDGGLVTLWLSRQ
jgi:FkbM family methyltransferase